MDLNAEINSWTDDEEEDLNAEVGGWTDTPSFSLNEEVSMWDVDQGDPVNMEAVDYSARDYTVNDLTSDEFYAPIQRYMTSRFGTHIEQEDREEVVSQFINNMRGFSGGNSVRTVNEVTFLSSLDDEQAAQVGEAYAIFENLPGIFNERNTWGETLEGMWDYTRSGVLDPANLVGGVIGKSVSGAGFKGTAVAAQVAAKKAFQRTLTKRLAAGAAQEVAQQAALDAASKVFVGAGKTVAVNQARNAATRAAAAQAAGKTLVTKVFNKANMLEAGVMAGFDSLLAGASDYAYQNAMIRTNVQDEYSVSQTALNAVTTMVAGGALYSLQGLFRRSTGDIGPDLADLKAQRSGAQLTGLGQQLGQAASLKQRAGDASAWIDDVAAGKSITDIDDTFWTTMLNGDESLGIEGLTKIIADQGYVFIPADENDNITNFLGDIIKEADPQGFKAFIDDFSNATGNPLTQIKGLTQEEFANTFKKKISDSARVQNAVSNASKALGIEESNLSAANMWNHLMGDSHGKWEDFMQSVVGTSIPRTQNQLIRLLVSNLSTTQLNLLGWSAASSMDTATDLVTAALQAPVAFVKGDRAGIAQAKVLAQGAITKIANTLDPNTTYDQYLKYVNARPQAMRELTGILPGGVESTKKLYRDMDIDRTFASMRIDQGIDTIQQFTLVRAQDGFTKSIEFMSDLDKQLRMPREKGGFGMSYQEFMAQPDYWKQMNTKEFRTIEQRAMTTALDNVFSRSYGNMGGPVGDVADFIEKTRNIPLVGVLLPFGRFFNNTVAFMSDYSGMSAAGKMFGLNKKSTETLPRLLARSAVGWGLITSLAAREQQFIDMGLGWDEQTHLGDATGAITSEKYNFPYSFFKGAARIMAHKMRGEEIPENTIADWMKTVGTESFTREFTDTFGQFDQSFIQMLNEDGAYLDLAANAMTKIVGQTVSGATRFAEPINSIVGMAQGGDRIVQDRRQGSQLIQDSTRYLDNIIGLASQGEQRYTPTRGPLRPQDSKFLAPVREVVTTNMSRLAALAGIPEWDKQITMIGKDAPEASNRYAKLYHEINEEHAKRLLNDPQFTKASTEVKKILFKKLLEKNSALVKNYMEADVYKNDGFLLKYATIRNNYKERDISSAMEELGLSDIEPMELDQRQLDLLDNLLKFREDILTTR